MNREQLATALTELASAQAEMTWWGSSVLHKRNTAKSTRDGRRNDILAAFAKLEKERDDLLAALENVRDTIESCYVAGGWVSLDAEEMESIALLARTAIAAAKGEAA